MMMKILKISLLSSSLILTALFSGAAGQIKDRVDRAGRLQYDVAVSLKLIQVYVIDKKGNPIPGLKAEDFEIFDNGRGQKITAFETHALPPLPASLPPAGLPKDPSETTAAGARVRLPRKFYLLIDYFRNDMSGVVMAKTAARHFLETQVLPADETALVSFIPRRGIVIERPPTTDHRSVLEAVEKLRHIPYLDDGTAPWPQEIPGIDVNMLLRNRADLTNEFSHTLLTFAQYLRSVPGIKNIIFYSRGIPLDILGGNVAPAGAEGTDPSDSAEAPEWGGKIETGGFTVRNYSNTIQELATSNSAIYAVNTQGLKGYQAAPESRGGDNLKGMADLTGGKYFADAIHYKEIDQAIQATTGNYYILGYQVSEVWDGAYHTLAVKVPGKEYEIRAQQGYFSPKPFRELTALEKEIHLLSLARLNSSGGPVPSTFGAAAFSCPGDDPGRILLLTEIPAAAIKDSFGPKSEVSIFILAKDDRIVYSAQGAVNFTRMPDKPLFGYLTIPLAAGEYDCRIVVRDLETGQGAVAASAVSLGSPSAPSVFAIFPPFLFRMNSPAAFINLTRQESPDSLPEPRLLKQIYRFVSNGISPVVDEIETGRKEIMAAVLMNGADDKSSFAFTGILTGGTPERKFPLAPIIVSSELWGNKQAHLLSIELPDAPPGQYTLALTARNETSNEESRVMRTFLIR
jgi:VWFA-related protein